MMPQSPVGGAYYMNVRSHVAAGLLAILLGTFGAHKFYNGSWGWGIIEGILYLVDPAAYDRKYNRTPEDPWKW
jgi:hypothetical protein